jgi:hypothetical protein
MKRVAVIAILAAIAMSALWIGTTHRDSCIRAGYDGCSFLPWSGHPAPVGIPLTRDNTLGVPNFRQ